MRMNPFRIFNSIKGRKPVEGENWIELRLDNAAADAPADILVYEPIGKTWDGSGLTAKNFKAVLDQVPKDRALNVRINSKGGDVWEGMAIKTMLDEWPNRVVAFIDGIAASTASWMALGADEIRAAKNSQIFAHDAIAFGFGNAEQMRKTADRLDTTSDQIAGMYADKTGKTQKEMRKYMRDETLWTAEEAHKLRLVDTITETKAIRNFSDSELTEIRDRLRMLNRTHNEPAPGAATNNNNTQMKKKLIAMLNKHGVTTLNGVAVSEEMAEEQLEAALNQLLETKKTTPAAPPAAAPPSNDAKIVSLEEFQAMKNRLDKLAEADTAAKRLRITNEVEKLIANDQLPANLKEKSIELAMGNEEHLNVLRAMPSRPAGAEPVTPSANIETTAGPDEVLNAFDRFQDASRSWLRGNSVDMRAIAQNSIAAAMFYNQHRDRVVGYLNAAGDNTIAAGLKRQVILQEALNAFSPALLALRAFSTVFSNIPLQGTDKINVPFYDLETAASTAWNAANGYVAGETNTDTREITINKRYYQSMGLTSVELARQPFLNKSRLVALKAEKLALDVFQDILSVVTAANYAANTVTKAAVLFGYDDVADLRTACNNANWPEVGRGLILNSDYDGALVKDPNAKDAINQKLARPGDVPNLLGFDYYKTNKVPANNQNLVGMAVHVSAILVALSPIEPAPSVRKNLAEYRVVTDPLTGATFEYKEFGSAQMDNEQSIVECNYGFAKGNAAAIDRIKSAA